VSKVAFVITAAGLSTRFSKELGREALKCIYSEEASEQSILHRLVTQGQRLKLDPIIVVGGHRLDELRDFLSTHLPLDEVHLVENPLYRRGALYSLHLGLRKALQDAAVSEVVFAEGDLMVDSLSFERVVRSQRDVSTTCPEPITARRSVALYINTAGRMRYVYDSSHESLQIPEPFRAVYNSGQVWKFRNLPLLRSISDRVTPDRFDETNLGLIQEYFDGVTEDQVEIVPFSIWHNCNTPSDYRRAIAELQAEQGWI
jgi:CTP:molybdopterin cytidylyltransferase MocA